jgi:hypothetical protein
LVGLSGHHGHGTVAPDQTKQTKHNSARFGTPVTPPHSISVIRRAGGGTADEADRLQELNWQLAGKGFGEKDTAQDVKNKMKDMDLEEAGLRTQQLSSNRSIERDARIKSLSMQEEFAPTAEGRRRAKKAREAKEDEATVEGKTAEYSKTMDQRVAKELAVKETELDRLKIQNDEAGTPRVDSLTAVGGGATGFVGGGAVDIQKSIRDKTEELKQILTKVESVLKEQDATGKALMTKLEG